MRRRAAVWSSPEALETELIRSRRYGRTFGLVRITCPAKASEGPSAIDELTLAVSSLVRGVDRVWAEGTSIYVLLPECDREMSEGMLARLREPLAELRAVAHSRISSVVFPDDGVTGGALLKALDGLTISLAGRQEQFVQGPPAPEAPAA